MLGHTLMENRLELINVLKRYGDKVALDHVSLALKPGIYGLLGQNGAGKSTLMHLLAGIQDLDEGCILWNGEQIGRLGESYRRILGYMPQSSNADIDLTVTGFLRYMAALKKIKNTESVIKRLIHYLHLKEYRNFRLNQLSGGTKQRVMIAQSLLNNPKVLLLDEPTAGLDPVERMNLRNIIAENIIILKEGKVLAMQDQKTLMAHTCVYETDQARIINQHYRDGRMYTRYLSKAGTKDSRRVETTLDDVYLDWLG